MKTLTFNLPAVVKIQVEDANNREQVAKAIGAFSRNQAHPHTMTRRLLHSYDSKKYVVK